jgi:hypothetical protein
MRIGLAWGWDDRQVVATRMVSTDRAAEREDAEASTGRASGPLIRNET